MFCIVLQCFRIKRAWSTEEDIFQTWKRWSSKLYSQNFGGWFPPKHPQLLYQSEIFWFWLCQTCCQIQLTQNWLELQESLKFVNNSISGNSQSINLMIWSIPRNFFPRKDPDPTELMFFSVVHSWILVLKHAKQLGIITKQLLKPNTNVGGFHRHILQHW